jgi:IclR family transcriptional regulator, acetate operon repressor
MSRNLSWDEKPLPRAKSKAPWEAARALTGATDRCFAILEFVAGSGRPLSASEISEALFLPKPSTYRLLETLERAGFVSRQGKLRRVSTGPRLTDLAFNVLKSSLSYAPRRQVLDALVKEVGETCNIGALDHNEIVYLDRVESTDWPLRLQFKIGSKVPLHCTAIGKLFLAFMPAEKCRLILDKLNFDRYTANTIMTRKALEAELQEIRKEGLALDREEYIVGVVCIAAPILDRNRNIQAAVAIQAPSARMAVAQALEKRDALARAAYQLSQSFALAMAAG